MTMFVGSFLRMARPATINIPAQRGRMAVRGGSFVSRQALPTDPAGVITLTFSGVKAGSELYIFLPDGEVHAGVEPTVANQQLVVQRYVSGSPNNTVRVLIASLGYENLDFTIELPESNSTIPVFQRIDRTYRNPA